MPSPTRFCGQAAKKTVMDEPAIAPIRDYLRALQDHICAALEVEDGAATFIEDPWTRPEGGGGITRILRQGAVFEQAGINFSHIFGSVLPPSATAQRPALAGRGFQVLGLSLVIHPLNPYVPTTHANVRFFIAERPGESPVWWFGGGFDLTPYYPFEADIIHWHQTAKAACDPFGERLYSRFKAWCDEYFYLPHRGETRGVGGLFFDDFDELGFVRSFAFWRSVGDHLLTAYQPIVARRKGLAFGDRERAFQQYRRGRYVEFNLLYDRGTRFGLQSQGRTESILMSLPPQASWTYNWQPEPGSPEARLWDFLHPHDWLRLEARPD